MENPEKFIKQKYWPSEEFREATEQTAKRTEIREGESVPNEPEARIENYLQRFTDVFEREDEGERERGVEAIKRLLRRKYIVKPNNITDEYIKGVLFGNFAEQKGYNRGDLKNPDIKQGLIEQFRAETRHSFEDYKAPQEEQENVREMAIKDQEARLDSWFSYLTSPEAENVPTAYRYWAFAEMLKLGSYDDDRKAYNSRTETTAANFPKLDQQALARVLDEVIRKQKGEPSQIVFADPKNQAEFRKRLQSENFGKLYASVLEHLKSLRLPTERLIVTEGKWRVFPKGSDAKEVVESLKDFHTQWCIDGEGTATGYLAHSDLHIYFSKDVDNNNTIPRACVVASKERGVTEVRGIMSDETSKQHLDDHITPVVEKRLDSIPGGEKWRGQMQDMKHLANIHLKHSGREELEKEDLRFLYEIGGKIQSTGYDKDPRIAEILKGRDIKEDLSAVIGVPREQISTTKEEALSGNIKYHYGSLNLGSLSSAEGLKLPESIGGGLNLESLSSAEGLKLPESIGGGLYLGSLSSAEGLKLPESIGGYLDLNRLSSAEGLKLPESIDGYLDLRSLSSAEGLKLPESIGGGLYLNSLSSAEGLKLPESVGENLDLRSLSSAEKNRVRQQYPLLRIL
jgi:hypothetical protein